MSDWAQSVAELRSKIEERRDYRIAISAPVIAKRVIKFLDENKTRIFEILPSTPKRLTHDHFPRWQLYIDDGYWIEELLNKTSDLVSEHIHMKCTLYNTKVYDGSSNRFFLGFVLDVTRD